MNSVKNFKLIIYTLYLFCILTYTFFGYYSIGFDDEFFNIALVNKSAWLGILIGDKDYRGKGIAREIIVTSILWISQKYKIESIKLGVDPDNFIDCRLYQKMGFEIIERSLSGGYIMEIRTENLNEN